MKLKHSPPMLLGLLLAFTFAPPFSVAQTMLEQQEPNVYVGIDIAYGGLAEIKSLVDQASTYTNLIVFGVTAVTNNETLLVPACQYSYDRGMYFIAYQAGWGEYNRPYWNSTYDDAKAAWGDHLLGVYQLDEPGGKEIDNLGTSGSYVFRYNRTFIPTTYSEFTTFYQQIIGRQISRQLARNETVFTSDYALYWFDYKAGYNCVLAEFTMKNNRQLAISLVRGAAEMQNKEWGVMITWDQDSPPYIESGKKLYQDMVLAYDNGAKYIVVFDANKDHTGSTLQPEHYLALQQFWQYTQSNPRKTDPINTRTGYVMPYGYGFGFRWSTDKVWGLPDPSSPFYYDSVNSLLQQYGTKLDIVYDDGLTAENVSKYASAIYHYSFTPPTPTATATPSQTPSPAPTQLATSTPTPEPTPSPSQTPTLSISPTPSPSPTQSPSPSIPELPTNISVAALILASTLALALIRKKHKDSSFP